MSWNPLSVPRKHWLLVSATLLLLLALLGFQWVLLGLSVARREPRRLEVTTATWLLHHSVPASAKAAKNPLGNRPDPAAMAAGHDLFVQKCSTCHAYDGGGKTEMGAGEYPRPPALHVLLPSMSDGEVFYHIRNGIRNTAMPAWNMPDDQIWRLVAYLRTLPLVAPLMPGPIAPRQEAAVRNAHYVGSATCQTCHQEIYARWARTRMANVVRDPRLHPDAIIPDLSKPDALVKFKVSDIALVYGSHWKQRYFKKSGDTYTPFPVQWDITNKKWLPYHVPDRGGDWWGPFYPDKGDNANRPTGPLCDGCHSVNYNPTTRAVAEWNVSCEMCHGAGSAHVANPAMVNILNPARQGYVKANDTCIQCHSQG